MGSFFPPPSLSNKLLPALYEDDGTLINQAKLYPSFSNLPYSSSSQPNSSSSQPVITVDPTWQPVVKNIKDGFLAGMDEILSLDLEKYRSVYAYLLRQYGISDQFDFTGFEVRLRYIKGGPDWNRGSNAELIGFTHNQIRHDAVKQEIQSKYLDQTNPVKAKIEALLEAAETSGQITTNERRLNIQLLRLQFGVS